MSTLLERCRFPSTGTMVDLAVSGGADSVSLALLAHEAGLRARVHHVDHQLRADSSHDARLVEALAAVLGFEFVLHVVRVEEGGNLESRARSARRGVLPSATMTGHSMDDLAETVLINLFRGAGIDGLSPMVNDPSKPLIGLRRAELLALVELTKTPFVRDVTNSDVAILRNRVRLETLPLLNETAGRDLVPLVARQAELIGEERQWLDQLAAADSSRALDEIDCRELATWPTARLRRWLRVHLRSNDAGDGEHPPSADEVQRVIAVVHGEFVATEISGSRRVARRGQRLRLD